MLFTTFIIISSHFGMAFLIGEFYPSGLRFSLLIASQPAHCQRKRSVNRKSKVK